MGWAAKVAGSAARTDAKSSQARPQKTVRRALRALKAESRVRNLSFRLS
jgi:hypothetical protein